MPARPFLGPNLGGGKIGLTDELRETIAEQITEYLTGGS
jgi:hypothetical protein